jgi:hypothetical protein
MGGMTARSFQDYADLGRRVAVGELTSDEAAATADLWHTDGVREAEAALGIHHVDGTPWHEAPLPKRWHRCWVQTCGLDAERCPCGAIRLPGVSSLWAERNSRRRP